MKKKDAPRCIDNIFSIINMFLTRNKVTTAMISDELGISRRTSQRYMNDMSTHMNIVSTEEGAYCLLHKMNINEIPKADPVIAETLYSTLKKITGSDISKYTKTIQYMLNVRESETGTDLAESGNIDYSSIKKTAQFLNNAIKQFSCVSFYYERNNKHYTVSPYKLLLSEGLWYLAAYSADRVKTFRLDYMKNIDLSSEFYVKITPEIKDILNNISSSWISDKKTTVKIKIDEEIKDYFLKGNIFRDIKFTSENPYIAEVTVSHYMEIYQKLVPFTPYYEILTPEVRDFFYNCFKEGAERNKPASEVDRGGGSSPTRWVDELI